MTAIYSKCLFYTQWGKLWKGHYKKDEGFEKELENAINNYKGLQQFTVQNKISHCTFGEMLGIKSILMTTSLGAAAIMATDT